MPDPSCVPRLRPVDSRSLAAVGYDHRSHALYVRFRDSGHLYRIADVPEPMYEQLLTAPSKGRFYNRWIRPSFPDVTRL
jgi:hypothetical protein